METAREGALLKYVITIQRAIRGWYQRRTFLRLKKTIIMIQSAFRAAEARVAYHEMKVGYARLQGIIKFLFENFPTILQLFCASISITF
jgi:myosin-7